MLRLPALLKNRLLVALMLGHFTNDLFGSILPILYPTVKERFAVDNAAVGLVTLGYTVTASLFQPVFGHAIDRVQRRWFASAALIWSAAIVSLFGFAPSYWTLFGLAALAGLGSSLFHPIGATNAARSTDDRRRNSALSLYTVGGTSGYALGPLVMVGLFALVGRQGTAFFALPGIVAAVLVFRGMAGAGAPPSAIQRTRDRAGTGGGSNWRDFGRVMIVAMLRSWVFLSLLQFLPIWYDEMGYGRPMYGALATVIILAGVAGTLAGGVLADRVGGRAVVVVSMALSLPALLLFAGFPGALGFITGAAFGMASDASLSVTLVAAQRLLPGRPGVASGMVQGLGFVAGGVGVPITGAIADRIGIDHALMLLSILSGAAAILGLAIPRRAFASSTPPIDENEREAEPSERLSEVGR